jgi:leucyl-tRNA synthetase
LQKWEQDGVFEANPPSIDDIPLDSISAADLREKYPRWHGNIAYPYMVWDF